MTDRFPAPFGAFVTEVLAGFKDREPRPPFGP